MTDVVTANSRASRFALSCDRSRAIVPPSAAGRRSEAQGHRRRPESTGVDGFAGRHNGVPQPPLLAFRGSQVTPGSPEIRSNGEPVGEPNRDSFMVASGWVPPRRPEPRLGCGPCSLRCAGTGRYAYPDRGAAPRLPPRTIPPSFGSLEPGRAPVFPLSGRGLRLALRRRTPARQPEQGRTIARCRPCPGHVCDGGDRPRPGILRDRAHTLGNPALRGRQGRRTTGDSTPGGVSGRSNARVGPSELADDRRTSTDPNHSAGAARTVVRVGRSCATADA